MPLAAIDSFTTLREEPKDFDLFWSATMVSFDSMHFADRLDGPAMVGIGLDDDVVPSRAVIAISNHVATPRIEVRILPVAHSDDPRESLWKTFDDEWIELTLNGVPEAFGDPGRQVRTITAE